MFVTLPHCYTCPSLEKLSRAEGLVCVALISQLNRREIPLFSKLAVVLKTQRCRTSWHDEILTSAKPHDFIEERIFHLGKSLRSGHVRTRHESSTKGHKNRVPSHAISSDPHRLQPGGLRRAAGSVCLRAPLRLELEVRK